MAQSFYKLPQRDTCVICKGDLTLVSVSLVSSFQEVSGAAQVIIDKYMNK